MDNHDQSDRYAYRNDPMVPGFDDDSPLIVYDGVCILCSGFIQFVVARDTAKAFRFATAQGPLGQGLYRHLNMSTADFETNLLVADGIITSKLDAFIEILRILGAPWNIARALYALPRSVRNWLYDRIAKNRYTVFGRTETCMVPAADWRDRVIGS